MIVLKPVKIRKYDTKDFIIYFSNGGNGNNGRNRHESQYGILRVGARCKPKHGTPGSRTCSQRPGNNQGCFWVCLHRAGVSTAAVSYIITTRHAGRLQSAL